MIFQYEGGGGGVIVAGNQPSRWGSFCRLVGWCRVTKLWQHPNMKVAQLRYGDLLMSTFISWFTPESEMLMVVAGARRRAEGTVGEVGSGTGWEQCMKYKNNMWSIVIVIKTFAEYSCKLVLISSNQITDDHFLSGRSSRRGCVCYWTISLSNPGKPIRLKFSFDNMFVWTMSVAIKEVKLLQ